MKFNRTRSLYHKLLQGNKPTDADIDRTIEMGRKLENLQRHPGWKYVAEFMEHHTEATHEYMSRETSVVSVLSLPWLFSTFLKYLSMLFENRAYRKITTYMEVSIQNGRKHATRRARSQETATSKE